MLHGKKDIIDPNFSQIYSRWESPLCFFIAAIGAILNKLAEDLGGMIANILLCTKAKAPSFKEMKEHANKL